jgi:hypothetical protein
MPSSVLPGRIAHNLVDPQDAFLAQTMYFKLAVMRISFDFSDKTWADTSPCRTSLYSVVKYKKRVTLLSRRFWPPWTIVYVSILF